MSLAETLEYIQGDELVEIYPKSIRICKRLLKETDRHGKDDNDATITT